MGKSHAYRPPHLRGAKPADRAPAEPAQPAQPTQQNGSFWWQAPGSQPAGNTAAAGTPNRQQAQTGPSTQTERARSFRQLVQAAEECQKQAERRPDEAARGLYREGARLCRSALSLAGEAIEGGAGPSWQAQALEVQLLLGAHLQALADVTARLPSLAPPSPSVLREAEAAIAEACQHYSQAVDAYQPCINASEPGDGAEVPFVNCARALRSWGELCPDPSQAVPLLQRSVAMLESALSADVCPEDSRADVLGSHAGSLAALGDRLLNADPPQVEPGLEACTRARAAYSDACQLSHSANGDDLPGLLLDWGAALHTMAGHAAVAGGQGEAVELLEEAASRFRDAVSFGRQDVAPLNGIGDVHVAMAELAAESADGTVRGRSESAWLAAALTEGYEAALRIDKADVDALVGVAEANVLLGKAAAAAGAGDAQGHFSAAKAAYEAALSNPAALGSWEDRLGVVFNAACACVLAGAENDAVSLLAQLLWIGGTTIEEIRADEDVGALADSDALMSAAARST
ncbi:unnamed protein product [Pedinophyceae sp. YPF-701]|nr:unnamed protein product [Pedinophyceae sp. YPF-701]